MVLDRFGSNTMDMQWNDGDDGGNNGGDFIDSVEDHRNPLLDPNHNGVFGKRIKLSSHFHQGEENLILCGDKSPLGLTLSKTPSFINLIEMKLNQAMSKSSPIGKHQSKNMDVFVPQPMSEKLKASNFLVLSLRIGSWERISKHEGDLVTKCYYAKRKIVWEVLDGGLKNKIEIQWSDIEAIRATTYEDEPGILEIQLKQPPLFFRETNPQPRKHTLWQQTSDFTGGQAPICRRHYVEFPPGTLDKHYDKLLQCDGRLADLSRKPFPRLESPYFYGISNVYRGGMSDDLSFRFGPRPSPIPYALHHSFAPISSSSFVPNLHLVRSLNPPAEQHIGILNSNPLMSDMDFLPRNQSVGNYSFENQVAPAMHWGREGNNFQNIYDYGKEEDQIQGLPPSIPSAALATPSFSESQISTNPTTMTHSNTENHLFNDSLFAGSDDRNLLLRTRFPYPPLKRFQEGNSGGLAIGGADQFGYETENLCDDDYSIDGSDRRIYPQPIRCVPPLTPARIW
ncbi:hypothetical protein U1Q18_019966 [Sarracenia purpurea var. burkii]